MVAGSLRSFVANFADLVSRGGTRSATFTRGACAEPRRSGSGGWNWIAKVWGGERAVANPPRSGDGGGGQAEADPRRARGFRQPRSARHALRRSRARSPTPAPPLVGVSVHAAAAERREHRVAVVRRDRVVAVRDRELDRVRERLVRPARPQTMTTLENRVPDEAPNRHRSSKRRPSPIIIVTGSQPISGASPLRNTLRRVEISAWRSRSDRVEHSRRKLVSDPTRGPVMLRQMAIPTASAPVKTPNVHPKCRNVVRMNDSGFEELCHLVTDEDPDTALCGKDVTGYPWNPPWPRCEACLAVARGEMN